MTTTITKKMLSGLVLALFLMGLPFISYGQDKDTTILASEIIDQDVYDKKQQLIGEVDDMIIRRSGKVKKLTVEFGGILDIADKLVAVSTKRFDLKNNKITLDQTEQQIEKRSEFSYYAHGLRPGYYYRARPYPADLYGPGYYYGPYGPNPPIESYQWVYSPSRFLASVIMDRRLVNQEQKTVGEVQDLVINCKENQVEKIILSSMEILGEDVYVALPYKSLGFSDSGIIYDIDLKELKNFIYPYEK
ncbi:MAG: PRC-barrel domain-containing protein [Deltaproteobacteria bacterium]|nr:PRC-barrel domain-containing protein [Deltaproteobacteria bacterium]